MTPVELYNTQNNFVKKVIFEFFKNTSLDNLSLKQTLISNPLNKDIMYNCIVRIFKENLVENILIICKIYDLKSLCNMFCFFVHRLFLQGVKH